MRRFRPLWILLSLFLFASLLCLPAGLKRWTCSFHAARCIPPILGEKQGVVFSKLEPEAITKILSQPFHYLDRGAQSFVFASQDGRYVLKLFFFDSFPKFYMQSNMEKARKMMQSCVIAAQAADETGLIYLHFGPSNLSLPKLRLFGPAWHRTHLESSSYCFALQRRATLLKESLCLAYLKKDRDAFVKKVDAFFELLRRRVSMGILNSDPSLYGNFGFVGERAIEIDFGNYYQDTTLSEQAGMREIARYKKKLDEWASRMMPEWKEEIEIR